MAKSRCSRGRVCRLWTVPTTRQGCWIRGSQPAVIALFDNFAGLVFCTDEPPGMRRRAASPANNRTGENANGKGKAYQERRGFRSANAQEVEKETTRKTGV